MRAQAQAQGSWPPPGLAQVSVCPRAPGPAVWHGPSIKHQPSINPRAARKHRASISKHESTCIKHQGKSWENQRKNDHNNDGNFWVKYAIILSQCAARLTRHRAFYFGGGRQVGELQTQLKRNAKTIAKNVMADKWTRTKSNQRSIQKQRKIIGSSVWDHPGGSGGSLADQFGPRAAQGSKRAPKSCEKLFRF